MQAARREARSCILVVGLVEEILDGGWEELASGRQAGGSSSNLAVVLLITCLQVAGRAGCWASFLCLCKCSRILVFVSWNIFIYSDNTFPQMFFFPHGYTVAFVMFVDRKLK